MFNCVIPFQKLHCYSSGSKIELITQQYFPLPDRGTRILSSLVPEDGKIRDPGNEIAVCFAVWLGVTFHSSEMLLLKRADFYKVLVQRVVQI